MELTAGYTAGEANVIIRGQYSENPKIIHIVISDDSNKICSDDIDYTGYLADFDGDGTPDGLIWEDKFFCTGTNECSTTAYVSADNYTATRVQPNLAKKYKISHYVSDNSAGAKGGINGVIEVDDYRRY